MTSTLKHVDLDQHPGSPQSLEEMKGSLVAHRGIIGSLEQVAWITLTIWKIGDLLASLEPADRGFAPLRDHADRASSCGSISTRATSKPADFAARQK